MTSSEKREFVRRLVDTIELSPKQVRVRYNFDIRTVTSATALFRSVALSFTKKSGQLFENFENRSEMVFFKPKGLDGIPLSEPFFKGGFVVVKTPSRLKKLPEPEQIEKKIRLALGLFETAFEIKKFQLSIKYPNKTDRELNHLTMAMFEKGTK